jgi:hypothetical protein
MENAEGILPNEQMQAIQKELGGGERDEFKKGSRDRGQLTR